MSQTRIPIVAYGPLSPYLEERLKARFLVHALAADADPDNLPEAVREARAHLPDRTIRSLAAMLRTVA